MKTYTAQKLFRGFSLLLLVAVPAATLQGCSWFRKGGGVDEGEMVDGGEYEALGGDREGLTRPEDAPREVERPRGLRDASEVLLVIYFDFDRSEIRRDQLDRLDKNLRYLLKDGDVKVLIEGHCDERGTTEYNFALGERRAQAVREYFVRNGISPGRIQILSKGEEDPMAAGHIEAAWGKNRRAQFKFFD